jgi:hypothetical protein
LNFLPKDLEEDFGSEFAEATKAIESIMLRH